MVQIKLPFKLPLITVLLLILLPTNSESLLFQSHNRRAFVIKLATTVTTATASAKGANAAIDVSGLKVSPVNQTPGRAAPNGPSSGILADTKLGFQVGGGPRSEEEVRKIDEPRYAAVRKAQGLGPLFLEGVPIEGQQEKSEMKGSR